MMNESIRGNRWALVGLALILGVAATTAAPGLMRTQTLPLEEGWNSIYLEVTPAENAPEKVFAGMPVETVATFYPRESSVEYISDPGSAGWNKENWAIWYAPHRSDAFLSGLHALHGHQAYLILAREAVTWSVEGVVEHRTTRWKSDSFNHVGFTVDSVAPPTFAQYFAGSKAHQGHRIYRLVDNHWTRVESPAGTLIRSGEAYWIFSKGSSDFQGPLDLRLLHQRALIFGGDALAPLSIRNRSPMPVQVSLQTVPGPRPLPLSYRVRVLGGKQMRTASVPMPATLGLGSIEPGENKGLYLQVRPEEMTESVERGLLKITTDLGAHYWLPMAAQRSDLPSTP